MFSTPQIFEHCKAKLLSMQAGMLKKMRRLEINELIARNLRYFMAQPGAAYTNANSLGVAAGIAPNTVRNLLDPTKRTTTAEKPEGYPTLDKLAALSLKLGCEVWELLHPDIERSKRERVIYEQWIKLQPLGPVIHPEQVPAVAKLRHRPVRAVTKPSKKDGM
jgi:hypothetical protein